MSAFRSAGISAGATFASLRMTVVWRRRLHGRSLLQRCLDRRHLRDLFCLRVDDLLSQSLDLRVKAAHPEIKALAQEIIDAQTKEIAQMTTIKAKLKK